MRINIQINGDWVWKLRHACRPLSVILYIESGCHTDVHPRLCATSAFYPVVTPILSGVTSAIVSQGSSRSGEDLAEPPPQLPASGHSVSARPILARQQEHARQRIARSQHCRLRDLPPTCGSCVMRALISSLS